MMIWPVGWSSSTSQLRLLPARGGPLGFAGSVTTSVPVCETTPLAVEVWMGACAVLIGGAAEFALGNNLHVTANEVFVKTATLVSVTLWDACSGHAYVVAADAEEKHREPPCGHLPEVLVFASRASQPFSACARLRPPIQQRFGDMIAIDRLSTDEIGDRACDAHDAVEAARA